MPLAAGLLSHPDIVSVSCAVQMAKGFRFHLIVTSSTALAEAAVDAIVLCVRNEQGSSPALRWLVRGIETRAGSSPVTFPDLVRLVLEPVLGQYPDSTLQGALVVVDATGARTEERAAWSDLFRRMNELRNEFVRALRSSFIMILPEPLEVEFAHVASDFWSIRSSAIHLSTELRPLAPSREREQERERSIAGFAPPTQELETRVRELREQVKKPPTEIAQAALAVALGQLADNLAERGSAGRALELTLDARELLEQLVISAPHRVDFQRDLSVSYERMGDLMLALGQGDPAKAFFEKSLLIRERLARSEPDRADFQRDLSVSYDRMGDLMRALGQGDQAKAFFEKDLQIAERLARSEPDRADFQQDLALSKIRIAMVRPHESMSHLESALQILLSLKQKGARLVNLDAQIEWVRVRVHSQANAEERSQ
ncbi:MAG: tetratricopeptide repeat protein [Planctomycetes bacterium]|nr:tetratricopeptide repeat protein [Planctomycetota bacterium]